ncbi:unnamed protein product, partial [Rotaria sordida]
SSDSEYEEKSMMALSDSEIDEVEKQLINTNLHYESEDDDDTVYPYGTVEKKDEALYNEKEIYDSEEYSDDDVIYPNRSTSSSSNSGQSIDGQWIIVEPGNDKISRVLPAFQEKTGPNFPVSSCPSSN